MCIRAVGESLRRTSAQSGPTSARANVRAATATTVAPGSSLAERTLGLQHTVGNRGVLRLFRTRDRFGAVLFRKAPADATQTGTATIAPAGIDTALASVKIRTTEVDVTMLRPWEIYELVTANTPRKKALYLELTRSWSALASARKRLGAAEEALAKASQRTIGASSRPATKKGGRRGKKADPAKERAIAAAEVEKAEKRIAAATTAIKSFISEADDVVRRLRAQEQTLTRRKAAAERMVAALRRRRKPDATKLAAAEEELQRVNQRLAELPAAKQTALAEVRKHIDAISFAPQKTRRTIYEIVVDGETVRLSDRVEAWPTKYAAGLVEHGHRATSLGEVLDAATISDSKKKILRAISANESGGAPFSSLNTYDRAVLTWGLVQWTGGRQSDLTSALTTIKRVAPRAFATRFQRYGIDVVADELVISRGDGTKVSGDNAARAIQGGVVLSAVMSRAGYDPDIQEAEVVAAADQQISRPLKDTFLIDHPPQQAATPGAGKSKPAKVRLAFKDVLTSEFAVGLFADQVVNSGGPGTKARVAARIRAYVGAANVDPTQPSKWAADAEKAVVTILAPFANRRAPFEKEGLSKAAGTYKE